jgi:metal-dependent amidase/aminoacylase/carboxypeptidase family protein
VKRTAAATATMANAPAPEIAVTSGTAAIKNDPALTARTAAILQQLSGNDLEVRPASGEPLSASEDFPEFTADGIPSVYYTLGAYDPKVLAQDKASGTPVPVNHSPLFAPAMEPTLSVGIRAMTYAAMNLLRRP